MLLLSEGLKLKVGSILLLSLVVKVKEVEKGVEKEVVEGRHTAARPCM